MRYYMLMIFVRTSLLTSAENIMKVKETTFGEGVVSPANLVGGRSIVGFTSSSRSVRYSRGSDRSAPHRQLPRC